MRCNWLLVCLFSHYVIYYLAAAFPKRIPIGKYIHIFISVTFVTVCNIEPLLHVLKQGSPISMIMYLFKIQIPEKARTEITKKARIKKY